MSFSSAPLGGTPIAGFDVDELVRRLWQERTGIGCWGGFGSVLEAARGGHLDWLKKIVLIYISGSPCPEYSKAGSGRGLAGSTGSLWLDDCGLGIRLRPPVIIREMVTGIFDFDVDGVKPHNFRIGGATALFAAGVTAEEIQVMGRRFSDVYRIYCRLSKERLLNLPSRMSNSKSTQFLDGQAGFMHTGLDPAL